jgi:hypothetical protein
MSKKVDKIHNCHKGLCIFPCNSPTSRFDFYPNNDSINHIRLGFVLPTCQYRERKWIKSL